MQEIDKTGIVRGLLSRGAPALALLGIVALMVVMPGLVSAQVDPFSGMSCLLYTSPSPRDVEESRMPSSA